jgi:hypothetical protein
MTITTKFNHGQRVCMKGTQDTGTVSEIIITVTGEDADDVTTLYDIETEGLNVQAFESELEAVQ